MQERYSIIKFHPVSLLIIIIAILYMLLSDQSAMKHDITEKAVVSENNIEMNASANLVRKAEDKYDTEIEHQSLPEEVISANTAAYMGAMEGAGGDYEDQPIEIKIKKVSANSYPHAPEYHSVMHYNGAGYDGKEIMIGDIYTVTASCKFDPTPLAHADTVFCMINGAAPLINIKYDNEKCKQAGINLNDITQRKNFYWGRIENNGQIVPQSSENSVNMESGSINGIIQSAGDYAFFYHKE